MLEIREEGPTYIFRIATYIADSIVLANAITSGLGPAYVFGVTVGSSMNISFLSAPTYITAQNSAGAAGSFGAGTMSSSWTVHDNVVSFGFGSTQTTILFSGGGGATLQGGVFETANGTNMFSLSNTTTGTATFGIVGSIPTFS